MRRSRSTRRARALVAGAAAAVLACSLLTTASSSAATTSSVTLNLATLPEGPPPAMPYFDTATEQVRDGARVVDLTGLQRFTHPTWLWKVNGGYVLDRYVKNDLRADENQLLFVSNSGRAILLSRHLREEYANVPLVVSSQYGRVVYAEVVNSHTSLVVNEVPSGKRVAARAVQSWTQPITYRGRVLARHLSRAFYWKPGVTAVETDHRLDRMVATDLRAGQTAFDENPDRIAPYPPGTGSGWTDSELDLSYSEDPPVVWSTDHQRLAAQSYVAEGEHDWNVVHLRQAADGAPVLDIATGDTTDGGRVYQVWWETADAVLMHIVTSRYTTFAMVRCTTAGFCNRIGSLGSTPSVVPATRNVS